MSTEAWSEGALRLSRRSVLAGAVGLGSASVVSGCSKTQEQGSGNGPKTVEIWIWETVAQWQQVIKESGLAAKYPDVTFKITALNIDQLSQKALTALGAGVASGLPSIIRISMGVYRSLVQTKALSDFTDVVNQHKSEILPGVYDGLPVEGKIYAAPDDTGVMLFGYRNDIFAKAGLPSKPAGVEALLATYDNLMEVGAKLQGVGAKLFNDTSGDTMFNNLILQDTTGYFDQDGNVIFDSDQHVKCAEVSKQLYGSGYLTSYENSSPQMWSAYKHGKLATTFYPNWQDFVILQNAPQTKGKWNVVKMPAVMPGGKRASSADGVAMIVPSSLPDDQRKLAMDVVQFLKLTKDAQIAHMKTFDGAFCSYQPALEAMAAVPSPVLDGQFTYKLDLDTARDEAILPWYRTSVFFSDAAKAVTDALFKICKQNAAIPQTLKTAADSIRSLQNQRGVK